MTDKWYDSRAMDENGFRRLIRRHLGEHADRPGSVLYSGLDTLARGDFYFNPADADTDR